MNVKSKQTRPRLQDVVIPVVLRDRILNIVPRTKSSQRGLLARWVRASGLLGGYPALADHYNRPQRSAPATVI